MILSDDGPAVGKTANVGFAGVDHGLDGEGHAGLQRHAGAWTPVMHDLWFFVKAFADAVAAKFAHHTEAVGFGVALYRMADVAQPRIGFHRMYAAPHAFVSDFDQALGLDGWHADIEHAAGVAVPAILDDRDVDVDDIAVLELFFARHAVADDMIDRSADRF